MSPAPLLQIMAAALLLLAARQASAQTAEPEEQTALALTPKRLMVPVTVDGHGPHDFMVDTGSQRSILSEELARSLDLPLGASLRVVALTGERRFASAAIDTIRYGREVAQNLVVPVVAEATLGSAGVLGLDGLAGRRLVLDFRTDTAEVQSSRSRPDEEDGKVIVVRGRSRFGQLVLTDAYAEDSRVQVILDTGTEYAIGNLALLRRLRAHGLAAESIPVMLQSIAGGEVPAELSVVQRLTVGGVIIDNVPIVFTDAEPFRQLDLVERPAMLLGMQVLRLFDRVTIDFGRRRVDFLRERGQRDWPGGRMAGEKPPPASAQLAIPPAASTASVTSSDAVEPTVATCTGRSMPTSIGPITESPPSSRSAGWATSSTAPPRRSAMWRWTGSARWRCRSSS